MTGRTACRSQTAGTTPSGSTAPGPRYLTDPGLSRRSSRPESDNAPATAVSASAPPGRPERRLRDAELGRWLLAEHDLAHDPVPVPRRPQLAENGEHTRLDTPQPDLLGRQLELA